MLSASDLRRKYLQEESNRPRLRINELVIEDYYGGNRTRSSTKDIDEAGAFLLTAESSGADEGHESADTAWMSSSPGLHRSLFPADTHPVGSLPDEQAARWLPPQQEVTPGQPGFESTTSSPRFDPVDEDTVDNELASLSRIVLDEDDGELADKFPEPSGNWWRTGKRVDIELSEYQTEETGSAYSHQLPFMDDEAFAQSDRSQHPLSMSMMGIGEDEGTEVELDFSLDRDMQSTFNQLMDFESSGVQDDIDEYSDEEESVTSSYSPAAPKDSSANAIIRTHGDSSTSRQLGRRRRQTQ
ncbi:hypothetical protein PINS_up019383 [Pythium insidiosum]|nr:hypothetical protein PINS_up019383 [Pythium insidiosum]